MYIARSCNYCTAVICIRVALACHLTRHAGNTVLLLLASNMYCYRYLVFAVTSTVQCIVGRLYCGTSDDWSLLYCGKSYHCSLLYRYCGKSDNCSLLYCGKSANCSLLCCGKSLVVSSRIRLRTVVIIDYSSGIWCLVPV